MSVLSDAAAVAAGKIADRVLDPSRPTAEAPRALTRLPGPFVSHTVTGDVPAGAPYEDDLDFEYFGSGPFALSRILTTLGSDAYAQNAESRGILVSVSQRDRGLRTILEPVNLVCLRRLCELPFSPPVMLGTADRLRLHATAEDPGASGKLSFTIVGYEGAQLDALRRAGAIAAGEEGPVLLAQTVTVPAGATDHPITFDRQGRDLEVVRVVAACGNDTVSAGEGDVHLSLTPRTQSGGANLMAPMTVHQLTQLFERDELLTPLPVPGERSLTFYVDNERQDQAYSLSVVAVARPV